MSEASAMLPATIHGALESPRISDLIKAVGKAEICFAVEYEVIQMAKLLNVGGNLTGAQAEFIATQLVDMFPAESLADFKICFQRGAMGSYGEIFRMDGIVLRKWMEAYLDEKYQFLEADLMKQKDNEYQRYEQKQGDGEGYEMFKKWAAELRDSARSGVRPMSERDLKKEGQEKASRNQYPVTTEEYYAQRMAESKAFKEKYLAELREEHPNLTDEQLNRMVL